MTRHSLSLLLRNEPGALARIVVLFSSRGVDVESLSLAPAEQGDLSRLDVVVDLQAGRTVVQLIKQLGRIVDVKNVVDRTHDEVLELGA
ncbi:acetolactate synthase, small subunit [Lentzea albidocapillata subsp. violacea]|uniref:Acetolactate synthase small subunit n=1 Tax=Lentzea albidocapillata subsp. violacea TaxID=128104 RepID=A0A1G9B6F0_9PSEU|nr:acetolactate synthase small subunit [Lentzea albidocapillata]SDK35073.1 acetolactate synthase, small subunit [Lentzea albidocapillata subsp. violacea]